MHYAKTCSKSANNVREVLNANDLRSDFSHSIFLISLIEVHLRFTFLMLFYSNFLMLSWWLRTRCSTLGGRTKTCSKSAKGHSFQRWLAFVLDFLQVYSYSIVKILMTLNGYFFSLFLQNLFKVSKITSKNNVHMLMSSWHRTGFLNFKLDW